MKLDTLLYLPKKYPCVKFGCYSLIFDVINVSLTAKVLHIFIYGSKVLHMFVNRVLFYYKNVASVFI